MEALKERALPMYEKIKTTIQGLSRKTKLTISAVSLVMLFVAIGVFVFLSNKPYEMLFTGLNSQELTEITSKLTDMIVPYRIENNDTIFVPKEVEPQTKATLVAEGYPRSGFTYDIFNANVNMLTTDTEKVYYMTSQLEAKIAATIRMFEGVRDAKVTFALGSEKKYILDQNKLDSTASAVVFMQSGGSPTNEQVRGIQRLLQRSIPGLEFDKVSVIDGNGRDVSEGSGSTAIDQQYTATSIKMQIERQLEDEARMKILNLVNPVYGPDNVRVVVKSLVDIDKKIKEIINYIPSQDNKGVISNEVTSQNGGNGDTEGGVPGAESNTEVPVYPGVTTDGNKIIFQDDKSYQYLVSQVTEQIQSDAATYLDTTVSIIINSEEIPDDQLVSLKRLIANACGIEVRSAGEKIEILAMPFVSIETSVPNDAQSPIRWIIIAVIAIVAAGVAGAIVFFLSKKKRKESIEQVETQNQSLIDELENIRLKNKAGIDSLGDFKLGDVLESKITKLQEEICDFAASNPAIVAQLIKTWLRGEEEEL